jgi:hypothetical protein
LLVGCSETEKVSTEEVFMSDEKIIEAILTDGSSVVFNEKGGQYQLINSVLVGTTIEDKEISLPLDDVFELRENKPRDVPISDVGDSKIIEVLSFNNRLYIFNDSGGKYDKEKNEIIGTTKDGAKLKLNPDHILEIHIDQPQFVSKEDFKNDENVIVSQIVIINTSLVIDFNENGASYVNQKAVISGVTKNRGNVSIDDSDILYVKVERVNAAGTILTTLGVIAGILLLIGVIAAATKQSCPFVYSHDSEMYVFDAEPLGGAISRGLQRTDFSKLEHLKEVDGKYKLLVRNEVPETQHLDEMSLYIVDHPKGTDIITDLENNFHTIKNLQKPFSAKDENGNDLTNFVFENDYTFWQTKLPVDSIKLDDKLRHQLTFVFPKPKDIITAKLVINAGTSLWGSQMIRELLTLYGEEVDTWYERVDNMDGTDIEKEQMMRFVVREELYYLKILVSEEEGWSTQGLIFGGGPFIAETRTYDLDLINVKGDSLVIQLNPPYGFWTLDFIALEYESLSNPLLTEIKLTKAVDNYNHDLLENLYATDEYYYSMPEVGDYFLAEFDAQSQPGDKERTYFLKTTGYYELHLPKDQPIQSQLLYDIVNTEGQIVEYAMKLYNEWYITSK